jgi:hypothetical protein
MNVAAGEKDKTKNQQHPMNKTEEKTHKKGGIHYF